jgi:hypothetical protein
MKKTKSLVEVICAAAIVILGAVAGGEALQKPYGDTVVAIEPQLLQVVGEVEITGPVEVEVGELARLEVQGDRVKWDCIPKTLDGQAYGDNNQNYVASFRVPGIYTVIAAVYVNEDVEVLSFPIDVRGSPDAVVVVPDMPTVVVDNRFDEDLLNSVISWCNSSRPNKDRVMSVATVFGVVSIEMQEGTLNNSSEIINRTAFLNNDLNTKGLGVLMGNLQKELTRRSDRGELETVAGHLIVWNSIAEGLERYAGN